MIVRDLDINERIRDREVRLIDENGVQMGVMPGFDAKRIARERDLDLVKISPQAVPPVCKIMDYGKYKFDLAKKEKEAKKNQSVSELKEMWLSMTIEMHDLQTKARLVADFLKGGDKVKVSIRRKARQQAHPEIGVEVMNRFYALVETVGAMDKAPNREGRNIWMMLVPKKS